MIVHMDTTKTPREVPSLLVEVGHGRGELGVRLIRVGKPHHHHATRQIVAEVYALDSRGKINLFSINSFDVFNTRRLR